MSSKVYFISVTEKDSAEAIQEKLIRLLEVSEVLGCVTIGDAVAIKIHFGEEGNTGFVKAEFARVIYDAILSRGGRSFISDTNTLYRGRRMQSQEHQKLAYEHGFTPDKVGAEVVIPDDRKKENISLVNIGQQFVKTAKIASCYHRADVIVDVSHFKGHMMTGFGGALKNVGMGCATREGKLEQHCDVSPYILTEKCVGCGACVEVCPVKAIALLNTKACIDNSLCIGCASCIAACTYGVIDVNWESGGNLIQEKMVEYAYAVLAAKKGKVAFINFATKITKECDCLAQDDPRIVGDIGIFASSDPVSIDQACFDAVNKAAGKDIFKKAHPQRDGMKQLRYAATLGLGNLEYELIEVK